MDKKFNISSGLLVTAGLIIGLIAGYQWSNLTRGKEVEITSHELDKDFLPMLIKMPGSPVIYNSKVEEYQIVFSSNNNEKENLTTVPLRYSPFTGKKLSSGRGKLFMKPSDSEIKRLMKITSSLHSLEEVEKALGKPDLVFDNFEPITGRVKQYTYDNLSDTASVSFNLLVNGKITISYSGKQIKNNK